MAKDLFTIHIDKIKEILLEKRMYTQPELSIVLKKLKQKRLIALETNRHTFFNKLRDKLNLRTYSITSEKINKERYSINTDITDYDVVNSFEKKSFFSMTTSLNIQGLSDFRNDFIFYSQELNEKNTTHNPLIQKDIDKAFSHKYRLTKSVAKYNNKHIVYLTPKYTNQYSVIKYDEYLVSTIERALVEMVVNIQYFKSLDNIIDCFIPLNKKIDVALVFAVVKTFDFIYPYFQLIGFTLEKIGFQKTELAAFKEQVTDYLFYTEKNKLDYKLNSYWNIYYC